MSEILTSLAVFFGVDLGLAVHALLTMASHLLEPCRWKYFSHVYGSGQSVDFKLQYAHVCFITVLP